jgi:hypothetical protein
MARQRPICDRADAGAFAESRATTSTAPSVTQRDITWLRHATADEIDRALERGELDRLLCQSPEKIELSA